MIAFATLRTFWRMNTETGKSRDLLFYRNGFIPAADILVVIYNDIHIGSGQNVVWPAWHPPARVTVSFPSEHVLTVFSLDPRPAVTSAAQVRTLSFTGEGL